MGETMVIDCPPSKSGSSTTAEGRATRSWDAELHLTATGIADAASYCGAHNLKVALLEFKAHHYQPHIMNPYEIAPLLTDAQIDLVHGDPTDAIPKLELAIHQIRMQLLKKT